MQFTEKQKRISALLLAGKKTSEQIASQLSMSEPEILEEMKPLIKLKLIEKEGFPTLYSLKKEIAEQLKQKKEIKEKDFRKFHIRAYIEIQAVSKELLEKNLKRIEETMKKEKRFQVYACDIAEIIESEGFFASYLELELSMVNMLDLMRFVIYYGPSSIEFLNKDKITLDIQELQDSYIELIDILQKYTTFISKNLKQTEIDKLYKKII